MTDRHSDTGNTIGEFERLLDELRACVDGLREDGLDTGQMQQRLTELDELAARAAAALGDVAR